MALTNTFDQFGFFLKTSAPSDRWDDTEYTEALYLNQITNTVTNDTLDITNLSSPGTVRKLREFLVGSIGQTFQVQGYWDVAEETGQEILYQATIATGTMAATLLYWLLTTTASGLKEMAGTLRISSLTITGSVGQVPTISATLQITGQTYEQAGA